MEIRTVLLLILAVLAAFVIVYYQYFYKKNRKGRFYFMLAGLRFFTLLSTFLLLINPKFTKNEYFLEKANLVILTDNSSSIGVDDRAILANTIQSISANTDLRERFQIEQYNFASRLAQDDSLNFDGTNTNIADALSKIDEIYASGSNAVVLFTDGNQTLGTDYEFLNLGENVSVNPVVVGDTTKYEDISIGLVNSNTYAFLRNKFPIEVSVNYNGNQSTTKSLSISMDGNVKFRQNLNFGNNENNKTVSALLEAESVGIKNIVIQVESLSTEKNTFNNKKEIAIEVIDEKTTVTMVAEVLHPDLGALKKAIEANEQRVVNIKKPQEALIAKDETNLFILYQPSSRFKPIYDHLNESGTNAFTITGTKTNWGFLNTVQTRFFKENYNQPEEIEPVLNASFGTFGLSDFSLDNYPPLLGNLGDIDLKVDYDVLVHQRIRGVDLDKPLFAILKEGSRREAVLFGENIWRWRAQTYRNTQSFDSFDEFMGRLMAYLTGNGRKSRLELDYKLIYENSSEAKIRAYSFDESFNFDPNSSLTLKCTSVEGNFSRDLPMLLKGNYFEADLSDFPAGEYSFTVTKQQDNGKRTGTFKILQFNPEQMMISANHQKLQRLAQKANGTLFYMDELNALIDQLANSNRFTPVQKSRQNVVSLIDFRVLLGLMALTLALEWFLRKYNGLI
ncbi:VWA domain-containing protein [Flagellimonas sp.]|uniref:VWA domain-containing protein n=1 Tax=Flagellimonas sp. TaxID=2058762 RepID=UPI003B51480E